MSETALQKALRDGTYNFAKLQDELGIIMRVHSKHNNLVLFKYNQIASNMRHPIVRCSRGIILDAENNWEIVAYPFDKFFNVQETEAAQIDWSTAKVQEKLDGSLMSLYCYKGVWEVASSGSPDAAGNVHEAAMSFAELFWHTWDTSGYELPDGYRGFTFMFELTTPYNRIVVPYNEPRLTLIGVRDNSTLMERKLSDFSHYSWRHVCEFPLRDLPSTMESLSQFGGLQQEGYVVVDSQFNRVKIKHPEYVRFHRLRGEVGATNKRMLELLLTNESAETMAVFPEFKPTYDKVERAFTGTARAMGDTLADIMKALPTTHTQKDFAALATKSPHSGALFAVRASKYPDFETYLRSLSLDRCLSVIGLKSEVL
jgi:T4 RnlA family RNA ligase